MRSDTAALLTPAEVGRMFKVNRATVTRWANDGTLRGFRTPGGGWRFDRAEVEAFLPTPKDLDAAS